MNDDGCVVILISVSLDVFSTILSMIVDTREASSRETRIEIRQNPAFFSNLPAWGIIVGSEWVFSKLVHTVSLSSKPIHFRLLVSTMSLSIVVYTGHGTLESWLELSHCKSSFDPMNAVNRCKTFWVYLAQWGSFLGISLWTSEAYCLPDEVWVLSVDVERLSRETSGMRYRKKEHYSAMIKRSGKKELQLWFSTISYSRAWGESWMFSVLIEEGRT